MIGLKNIGYLFSALLWRWWYYFHPAYTFTRINSQQLPDYVHLPPYHTHYDKKKWKRLGTLLKRWGMLRPLVVEALHTYTPEGEEEYLLVDGRHRLYLWIKENPYNTVRVPVCVKRLTTLQVKTKNKIEKHKQDIEAHLKLLNTHEKN